MNLFQPFISQFFKNLKTIKMLKSNENPVQISFLFTKENLLYFILFTVLISVIIFIPYVLIAILIIICLLGSFSITK